MINTYRFHGNEIRIIKVYELYKNTPLRWSINGNGDIFCEVCSIAEYTANNEHYKNQPFRYINIGNKNYTIIYQYRNRDAILLNDSTLEVELYRNLKIIDIKDEVIFVNSNLNFIDKLK